MGHIQLIKPRPFSDYNVKLKAHTDAHPPPFANHDAALPILGTQSLFAQTCFQNFLKFHLFCRYQCQHCTTRSVKKKKVSKLSKVYTGSPQKTDSSSAFHPENISVRDCVTQLTSLPLVPPLSCPLFTTVHLAYCYTTFPPKDTTNFTISSLPGRIFSSSNSFTSLRRPSPTSLV